VDVFGTFNANTCRFSDNAVIGTIIETEAESVSAGAAAILVRPSGTFNARFVSFDNLNANLVRASALFRPTHSRRSSDVCLSCSVLHTPAGWRRSVRDWARPLYRQLSPLR
jgi:hypothetical protein